MAIKRQATEEPEVVGHNSKKAKTIFKNMIVQQSPISNLGCDILQHIASYCDKDTVINMRLSCKQIYLQLEVTEFAMEIEDMVESEEETLDVVVKDFFDSLMPNCNLFEFCSSTSAVFVDSKEELNNNEMLLQQSSQFRGFEFFKVNIYGFKSPIPGMKPLEYVSSIISVYLERSRTAQKFSDGWSEPDISELPGGILSVGMEMFTSNYVNKRWIFE